MVTSPLSFMWGVTVRITPVSLYCMLVSSMGSALVVTVYSVVAIGISVEMAIFASLLSEASTCGEDSIFTLLSCSSADRVDCHLSVSPKA